MQTGSPIQKIEGVLPGKFGMRDIIVRSQEQGTISVPCLCSFKRDIVIWLMHAMPLLVQLIAGKEGHSCNLARIQNRIK